jgi:hypothetical protein
MVRLTPALDSSTLPLKDSIMQSPRVTAITPLTPRVVAHRRHDAMILHARTPDAHARTRARVRASLLAVPSVPMAEEAEGQRRR